MSNKKVKGKRMIVGSHELIPKHSKLSEKEKKDFITKYKINSMKEVPKIYKSDPGIQTLNAKTGDIIKITRKGPMGTYFYYRVVVSA